VASAKDFGGGDKETIAAGQGSLESDDGKNEMSATAFTITAVANLDGDSTRDLWRVTDSKTGLDQCEPCDP
jgi:hypothetical protein